MPAQNKIPARKVIVRGQTKYRVIVPKDLRTGQRSHFFDTEEDAKNFAGGLLAKRRGGAKLLAVFPHSDQARIYRCMQTLGGRVELLEKAVEAFKAESRHEIEPVPLKRAITELIETKRKENKRPRYVSLLESTLERNFLVGRSSKTCDEITTDEISKWAYDGGHSLDYTRGKLINVKTLFSYAFERGYCAKNPAAPIELPTIDRQSPGVLTVDQCRALLGACFTTNIYKRKSNLEILPALALMLFGGVRESEVRKVKWSDVKKDHIDVSAGVSKVRNRRLIHLNDTLKAWLEVGKKGHLPPKNFFRRLNRIAVIAGIKDWPRNCLRHSFCSYGIPKFGMVRVSEDAGTSEEMLKKHYKALVTVEEAEEFWNLRPPLRTDSPSSE